MRNALLLAAGLAIGCASEPPAKTAAEPVPDYPPARCDSKVACDQMWARAIQYVQLASGMKVMTVTENYIGTYPANQLGRMTGAVIRYPISEGVYEIRLGLACYGNDRCADLAAQGVNLFNMSVAGPPVAPATP